MRLFELLCENKIIFIGLTAQQYIASLLQVNTERAKYKFYEKSRCVDGKTLPHFEDYNYCKPLLRFSPCGTFAAEQPWKAGIPPVFCTWWIFVTIH